MNHAARHALPAIALLALLAGCKPAATPDAATAAAPDATGSAAATSAPASATDRFAAAAAVNPMTSPRDTVIASMRRMVDAHSYHADMHFEGGKAGTRDSALDFVAPDRFRMTMTGMGTQYIIGNTMYLDMGGHRMQVPAPAATMQQWRDPAKLGEIETTMTVEDQGSDRVGGASAHKYLVRNTQPRPMEMTLWLDDAGLPLQLATHTAMGDVTTRYSRFNDPALTVEAPK